MRDFRASAKASRLIGGVWALGITTWAQPGQRTLDQEKQKQKQTGGAGKATQRVRAWEVARLLHADWPECARRGRTHRRWMSRVAEALTMMMEADDDDEESSRAASGLDGG